LIVLSRAVVLSGSGNHDETRGIAWLARQLYGVHVLFTCETANCLEVTISNSTGVKSLSKRHHQILRRLVFSGIVVAFAGAFAPVSHAGELSKDQMVKALQKKGGKTRSLVVTDDQKGASEVQNAVKNLGSRLSREIVVEERKQIAKAVTQHKLPAIDLTIPFEYDSSAISQKAVPVLVTLGQVLQDASLKGSTFLVGGHTDARGSNEYNITLSQKRAQSVRTFLIETFGINGSNLIAVGFGEIELKAPHDPDAGVNRRVQLVNVTN
jgi:outer membrane protein OmpA-like peptidoglycan-associated protein